jgi:hypothetical protein
MYRLQDKSVLFLTESSHVLKVISPFTPRNNQAGWGIVARDHRGEVGVLLLAITGVRLWQKWRGEATAFLMRFMLS